VAVIDHSDHSSFKYEDDTPSEEDPPFRDDYREVHNSPKRQDKPETVVRVNEVKSKNGKSLFKVRKKQYREENEDYSEFLKSVSARTPLIRIQIA